MWMISLVKSSLLFVSSMIFRNRKSKILFYHDVFIDHSYSSLDTDIPLGTPISMFMQHINTIRKEGFEIVANITQPENQVCIMFDDGFRGVWDNREYFLENNIRPTIFLAVDLIGKEGFLTKDEILELKEKYKFNFQCHTWHHIDLSQCNDEELEVELSKSKDKLSKLLGYEVNAICLPKGFFSDSLLENHAMKEYLDIYSSIPGNYCELVMGMRTRNLCQFASAIEVKLILRGGNELIKNRYLRLHHKPNFNK